MTHAQYEPGRRGGVMTLVFIVTEIYVALSAGCTGQIRTQLDYCETNSHPLQVY